MLSSSSNITTVFNLVLDRVSKDLSYSVQTTYLGKVTCNSL